MVHQLGYAIQQRGCHLGVAEDSDPFSELQIGGDDDPGFLVKLSDQVEQQCATGFQERDIAQLVDYDAIQGRQLPVVFPSIAIRLFFDQGIDQNDRVEEAGFLAVVDQGGSTRDGDMGFARPGAAHRDVVVRLFGELTRPTGLLWVRQGVLGLEPPDAKLVEKDRLAEARRDLLSSVAGEIEQVTGGRTMDRILKRCEEDLDALATGSRLSPRGAWKEAVEAAKALEAELEVLERQCTELSDALDERRAAKAELRRLDDPEAKAQRDTDLSEAREVVPWPQDRQSFTNSTIT